jgi:hypothetical protein
VERLQHATVTLAGDPDPSCGLFSQGICSAASEGSTNIYVGSSTGSIHAFKVSKSFGVTEVCDAYASHI